MGTSNRPEVVSAEIGTDSHAHILEYGGMKLIPLEETRDAEGVSVYALTVNLC